MVFKKKCYGVYKRKTVKHQVNETMTVFFHLNWNDPTENSPTN